MRGKVSLLALGSVTVLIVALFVLVPLPGSGHFDQAITFPSTEHFVYMGGLVDLNTTVGNWWETEVIPSNWSYAQHCWMYGFDMVFSAPDSVTGIVDITVPMASFNAAPIDRHSVWDNETQIFWTWELPITEDGKGQIYTGTGSAPVLGDVDMIMNITYVGDYPTGSTDRYFKNSTGDWNLAPTSAEMAANTQKYIGDGTPDPAYSSWLWLPMEEDLYSGRPPGTLTLQIENIDNTQWWNTAFSSVIMDYVHPTHGPHTLHGIYKDSTQAGDPVGPLPPREYHQHRPWDVTNGTVCYCGASGYIDEASIIAGAQASMWVTLNDFHVGSTIDMGTGSWTGKYTRYVGDVNDNNKTFTVDLLVFANSWGGDCAVGDLDEIAVKKYWWPMNETEHPGTVYTMTDFNGNDKVFTVDLLIFAKNWGAGV